VKLRHLPQWNAAREQHAAEYRSQLEGVGDIAFQQRFPLSTHVYHLFIVETEHRDELRKDLAGQGIQTGIHYPTPIHLQEAYSELGLVEGAFPETERLAKHMLSLPMYPELTGEQIGTVSAAISQFFRRT
jgi:dTDP-4-amino-4,6-dideoxygalactose transaminase